MNPVVSIIICTRDRSDHLCQTLESLKSVQIPQDLSAELLVVDNASADATPQVAKACALPNMTLRYVREERPGKSYAYNLAFAEARGSVFLCSDDDLRFPTNWVEGMCRPIVSGVADAVAGNVSIAPHLKKDWMEPEHLARLAYLCAKTTKELGLVGANMAFSRRVLKRVPAFDLELGAGALGTHEEGLFSHQVKRAGYRITPSPDVTVEHHFDERRLSRKAWLHDAFMRGRSSAYLVHHWQHDVLRMPRLKILRKQIQLEVGRLLGKARMSDPEAVSLWELSQLQYIHMHRHYLHERLRPRNYEPYGLVKLRGLGAELKP